MVEGCKTMLNKLLKIFRNFMHMVYYWIIYVYVCIHNIFIILIN